MRNPVCACNAWKALAEVGLFWTYPSGRTSARPPSSPFPPSPACTQNYSHPLNLNFVPFGCHGPRSGSLPRSPARSVCNFAKRMVPACTRHGDNTHCTFTELTGYNNHAPGLVNLISTVAYHFCPSLPACSIHATCRINFSRSLYRARLKGGARLR